MLPVAIKTSPGDIGPISNFLYVKPRSGFSAAVAFEQMTVTGAKLGPVHWICIPPRLPVEYIQPFVTLDVPI
jgi:hypothetical protein